MSLDLQPNDPKLPEDDSTPALPPTGERNFALKAVAGAVTAPFAIALFLAMDSQLRSPFFTILFLVVSVLMLFHRQTRAFGLGVILFVGVAFLVLLTICGNSHF